MKIYISTPIDGLSDEMRERLKRTALDLLPPIHDRIIPLFYEYHRAGHQATANRNLKWIRECDELWAINPHQSGGVTFEMGYAHALGKPIKIINLDWLESSMHCPTIMTKAVTG